MYIPKNFTDRWLAAGSSPVDWCEDNYTVSNNIAEFTNTVSNLLLLMVPIVMLSVNVWSSYVKHVSSAPVLMFMSMIFVGFSSIYFHGTLSLMGQFMDEISIAWTECIAYGVLVPKRYNPFDASEKTLVALSLTVSVIMTWLWFVSPFFYSFWILCMTGPAFGMVVLELAVYRTQTTLGITRWNITLFTIAVTMWLLDKLLCGFVLSLGLPGTHQMYHVVITFSCYLTITLFSFWRAQDYALDVKSTIKYFPGRHWGLPYVHCEKRAK